MIKNFVGESLAIADTNTKKIQPIDFLLLDFQMPRKNGLQVVKEIKEYYELKQHELAQDVKLIEPTIVFLTAFATTAFRNHVLSLGVNHVYEKPILIE